MARKTTSDQTTASTESATPIQTIDNSELQRQREYENLLVTAVGRLESHLFVGINKLYLALPTLHLKSFRSCVAQFYDNKTQTR